MHKIKQQAGAGGIARPTARYLITAVLELKSAAHIGGTKDGDTVDLELLRIPTHPDGEQIILPGSSLAGALRNYVCDYLLGYNVAENKRSDDALQISALFGRSEDEGNQSWLSVFDSPMLTLSQVEIRDGVALDPDTGRAADSFKFDLEVLPWGTQFQIHLELAVPDEAQENELLSVLALALSGLEKGEITIGARKTRGYGACRAFNWRIHRFDLQTQEGWLEWVNTIPKPGGPDLSEKPLDSVLEAISYAHSAFEPLKYPDARNLMRVEVDLCFSGGLLIRSSGRTADAADATHLLSGGSPVLPGTSLAGALRSRALRIARLVRCTQGDAEQWVEKVFGSRNSKENDTDIDFRRSSRQKHSLRASSLRVSESLVTGDALKQLRVGRVRIDRFTGGAQTTALYDEEPVYGGEVTVTLELRCGLEDEEKTKAMRGLTLLAVKDLITGDLNLGGTGAIGRGTACGTAKISWNDGKESKEYVIGAGYQADARSINELNQLVKAFNDAQPL